MVQIEGKKVKKQVYSIIVFSLFISTLLVAFLHALPRGLQQSNEKFLETKENNKEVTNYI